MNSRSIILFGSPIYIYMFFPSNSCFERHSTALKQVMVLDTVADITSKTAVKAMSFE